MFVVIGNGTSRKKFDLKKLSGDKFVTFGCNAIYKEFKPNYVVAIDDEYINILQDSDFPQHRQIIPDEEDRYELNGSGRRSNAGMNSMKEAVARGAKIVYCLGFDFLLKDNKLSVSNVFEGTKGYSAERKPRVEDNVNRVSYLNWFANKFADVEFVFVFERKPCEIYDLAAPNIYGMYYDDFEKLTKE